MAISTKFDRKILTDIDRPIEKSDEDLLGRDQFVERLAAALVRNTGDQDAKEATGYVIGLTGAWGSGKSSVLNLLHGHLSSRSKVIVVRFNPWLFQGVNELVAGFFAELSAQISSYKEKSLSDKAQDLHQTIDGYRDSINAFSGTIDTIKPGIGIAARLAIRLFPKWKPLSAYQQKKKLEDKIANLGCAIVILIDELDRLEDEEIRAMARLIKAVGDIRGTSYLVAYDHDRVVRALCNGIEDNAKSNGAAYLEKIIQLTIPLRSMMDYEVQELLVNTLIYSGYEDYTKKEDKRCERLIDILTKNLSTPRDIKRLIGNFTAIESMVHGEVNTLDILGYCYLLIKAPDILNKIRGNIDLVVTNPRGPIRWEHAQDPKGWTIEKAFGEKYEKYQDILKWLFPIFDENKGGQIVREQEGFDRDQIKRSDNIIRVLYLGDPPHLVSRKDVEELWNLETLQLKCRLDEIQSTNKLPQYVDRINDILLMLPECGDKNFWPSLSRVLMRNRDWVQEEERNNSLSQIIESQLRIIATKKENHKKRIKNIVQCLIDANDVIVTPSLLRHHLWRYGLDVNEREENEDIPVIFTKSETKALISAEGMRLYKEVESGAWLRRCPYDNILYFLLNIGQYDEALRTALTTQLVSTESIATFACDIVPPGYVIEASTLNKLILTDEVRERVDETIIAGSFLAYNNWIQSSVKRFQALLYGKNLMYFDD